MAKRDERNAYEASRSANAKLEVVLKGRNDFFEAFARLKRQDIKRSHGERRKDAYFVK